MSQPLQDISCGGDTLASAVTKINASFKKILELQATCDTTNANLATTNQVTEQLQQQIDTINQRLLAIESVITGK